MKTIVITFVALTVLLMNNYTYTQSEIPEMNLQSIDGENISTSEIFNNERPVLLIFWATWCTHTTTGLTEIQEEYIVDWQEQFNIKLVAVSIDDAKSVNRAVTVAKVNGWDFEIFLDVNGDFKRAMGVNTSPYLMLLDTNGKKIWQQNSYMQGDEEIIEQELLKLQLSK